MIKPSKGGRGTLEKKIRIWKRLIYGTLGVCFIGTIVWYLFMVVDNLSGMTTLQMQQSVDISFLFTRIEGYEEVTIANAPILFGLFCIVVAVCVQGISYMMLTRESSGKRLS